MFLCFINILLVWQYITDLFLKKYWYLLIAVFLGSQIGNFLNLKIFPTCVLALITGFLVLFVAIRMVFRFSKIEYKIMIKFKQNV